MARYNPISQPAKIMKAALYARVSTHDQDCEIQLRELREYVTRRGWDLAGEYVDTGISGAKANRPALDRLLAAAAQHQIDVILVYKLDRFGRSVLHLSQQLANLETWGVRFIATSQNIDTDASNPMSRLLLMILAAVAEFERELIRERTKSGLKKAKADGINLGRPRRVLDRAKIFPLRDAGASWGKISKALGVPIGTIRDAYAEYVAALTTSKTTKTHSSPEAA